VYDYVTGKSDWLARGLGEDRVLLGRLRKAALEGKPDTATEAVMDPGPSTVRADLAPGRLRERLERDQLTTAVITDPDGRLLGVVRRVDLPRG
jgi:Mg/Co/Ni transporter MgtE